MNKYRIGEILELVLIIILVTILSALNLVAFIG